MHCSECDATYFNIMKDFHCFHCAFIVEICFFFELLCPISGRNEQYLQHNKCKDGSLKFFEKAFTTLLKNLCLKQTATAQKKNVGKDKWHFKRGF